MKIWDLEFENINTNIPCVYNRIGETDFQDFCKKYHFNLKKTQNITQCIYHIIYWLYSQFTPNYTFFEEFQKYNGFEIFQKCKNRYSPNCACYAIMLNDILLAVGFKSKAVWCLSSDPCDTECHAVNHVYDSENKRWFVADPSCYSVICNEKGVPIDLITLRNTIKNGDMVYPYRNKSIRQSLVFIHEYNEYMKKNSFQFLTHLNQGLSYPLDETAILIHPKGYEATHNRPWKRVEEINYLYSE